MKYQHISTQDVILRIEKDHLYEITSSKGKKHLLIIHIQIIKKYTTQTTSLTTMLQNRTPMKTGNDTEQLKKCERIFFFFEVKKTSYISWLTKNH